MEQLERENQQLKDGAARAGTAQAGSLVDGELLRLQAENTALQKNVAGTRRPSLEMQRPWGLSRMSSPWGQGKGFRIRLGPAMNQCITLDKPFHLSESKLPHLQRACRDVHSPEDCSRAELRGGSFLSLVQCLVPSKR